MLGIIVAISALFVYYDATRNNIGKIPDQKGFTNISAGAWATVTLLMWIICFPMYLLKRKSLIEKAKDSTPKPPHKGVAFTILGVVLVLNVLTLNSVGPASAVGMGKFNSKHSELLALTPGEQAEVNKIKSSGNIAGTLGHAINQNTKLVILSNNFGEMRGCIISVQADDAHPNWNLKVQVGSQVDNLVFTTNQVSNNAGEVRLMVGDHKYSLNQKLDADGSRGTNLASDLLADLISSNTAKAVSGVFGDVEFGNTYDLSAFKKAYKYASAICT